MNPSPGTAPSPPSPTEPQDANTSTSQPVAPQAAAPSAQADGSEPKQRWPLLRLLRSNSVAQRGFTVFLAWWLVAVLLAMAAAGQGYAIVSVPSLAVGAADLVGLLITLGGWRRINTAILVIFNTAALSVLIPLGQVVTFLALGSVALMFGAAESGQRWWYANLGEDGVAPTNREQSDLRSAVEVTAAAVAAAVLVAILGFVESRLATVAALIVFALIFVGVWFLGRPRGPAESAAEATDSESR